MLDKTDEEIIKQYGKPEHDRTFVLSNNLYPYQSRELLILYPDYETKEVLIREIAWTKRKWRLLVWLKEENGKWIVIDNLKWRTDMVQY